MQSTNRPRALLVVLMALAVAMPATASMVLHMDLDGLSSRAELIFRGTVLSAEPGSVAVGGGALPTTTYRLRVEEAFKGDLDPGDKEAAVVEVTVIGDLKERSGASGDLVHLVSLPQAPRLVPGGEYVLFTTAPSAVGLSTTVGLGQGAFKIYHAADRREMAVNELGNLGLFSGPVTYAELADAIRAQVGN